MFRKLLFTLILLSIFNFSKAQVIAIQGQTEYPFLLHNPINNEVANERLPLIIFLHGRSLSGTNLNKVKRYGVINAVERGQKINAIIAAPQVNKAAWNPDKVVEILDYVKKNYPVDETKIYICGMSLGGYGTMHTIGKYPEKFAAAVALCGGGYTKDAANMSKTPLWIIHGDRDRAVPVSESTKIYKAIMDYNKDAPTKLTIVHKGSHGSVERYFHGNEMYDWLFEHSLKLSL